MNLFVESDLTFWTTLLRSNYGGSTLKGLYCLLLVLEVCNVQSTFRKALAANHLVKCDLTCLDVKAAEITDISIRLVLQPFFNIFLCGGYIHTSGHIIFKLYGPELKIELWLP